MIAAQRLKILVSFHLHLFSPVLVSEWKSNSASFSSSACQLMSQNHKPFIFKHVTVIFPVLHRSPAALVQAAIRRLELIIVCSYNVNHIYPIIITRLLTTVVTKERITPLLHTPKVTNAS